MPDIDLTRRETFRHWTPVTIRFSDQDSMAHVNNVALAAYVEAARTAYIYELIAKGGMEGLEFILARVVIDYHRELHYPGAVEVGARLVRLGNKSLTTGYGVFRGDDCVATSECVNVFYDMQTRKTVMPPAGVRAALEAELAG
ncbi:MAG TPA: thioesterase family protein [Thermohalobaculum sp.]|nr:thioesterase family protein [Thermohalobaculum sp.]